MDTQNTPEIKAFDGEIANQRPNAFLPYQPNRNPNKVQERQMIGNRFTQWSDATLPLRIDRRCNSYSCGMIKPKA
jgi:hypothetical protein